MWLKTVTRSDVDCVPSITSANRMIWLNNVWNMSANRKENIWDLISASIERRPLKSAFALCARIQSNLWLIIITFSCLERRHAWHKVSIQHLLYIYIEDRSSNSIKELVAKKTVGEWRLGVDFYRRFTDDHFWLRINRARPSYYLDYLFDSPRMFDNFNNFIVIELRNKFHNRPHVNQQ